MEAEDARGSRRKNRLGIAGLVVSLAGVLTLGLLSPLGLLLGLIGLTKSPRRAAAAGVVLGAIGTTFLALVGVQLIPDLLGLHEKVESAGDDIPLLQAKAKIEAYRSERLTIPAADVGQQLIADIKDTRENGLRYVIDGESYRIVGSGGDGRFDTEDDVIVEGEKEAFGVTIEGLD